MASLAPLLKVITIMVCEARHELRREYSFEDKKIIQHKTILYPMLEPKAGIDIGPLVGMLARDNEQVSKTLAKSYLKSINQRDH